MENPQKFLGIFPRNPRKFPGIFHRKIRWKCQQKFQGISCNPFLGISCIPFQGISCNPFQGISHHLIWGISFHQLQGISLENNLRNCQQNKGNSCEFPEKSSLEPIPGNFLGTIPKILLEISWDIPSIFLSKFTNKDLDPIAVNILTTIYVATSTA